MNYKKNVNFISISLILFVVFLIGLSLQQILSWQFAEMYSGMERLLRDENLYPENSSINYNLVSPYFPGISFLVLIIKKIFFFLELHYALNLLISVFFIVVLLYQQFLITKKYNHSLNKHSFFLISIFLYITLFRHHTEYAAAFKPDTIALVFFISAIILNKKNNNFFIGSLAGLIFACAVTFKQQGLIFFLTYVILISIKDFYRNKYFIISSILFLIIIFYQLLKFENFYEYTILSFLDDRYMSLSEWYYLHIGFFAWILIFIPFLFFKETFKEKLTSLLNLIKVKLVNFDALFFSLCAFGVVNFISSFKFGGNSGNTGFALICIYPYIFNLFDIKISKIVSIFLIVYIALSSYMSINDGLIEYKNFLNLENKIIKNKNDMFFFESKLYPLSLKLNKKLYFSQDVNLINLISHIDKKEVVQNKNIHFSISPYLYQKWKTDYETVINKKFIIESKENNGVILIYKK